MRLYVLSFCDCDNVPWHLPVILQFYSSNSLLFWRLSFVCYIWWKEFHCYVTYHFCHRVTSCVVKKHQGFSNFVFCYTIQIFKPFCKKLLGSSVCFFVGAPVYWKMHDAYPLFSECTGATLLVTSGLKFSLVAWQQKWILNLSFDGFPFLLFYFFFFASSSLLSICQ